MEKITLRHIFTRIEANQDRQEEIVNQMANELYPKNPNSMVAAVINQFKDYDIYFKSYQNGSHKGAGKQARCLALLNCMRDDELNKLAEHPVLYSALAYGSESDAFIQDWQERCRIPESKRIEAQETNTETVDIGVWAGSNRDYFKLNGTTYDLTEIPDLVKEVGDRKVNFVKGKNVFADKIVRDGFFKDMASHYDKVATDLGFAEQTAQWMKDNMNQEPSLDMNLLNGLPTTGAEASIQM